MLLHQDGIIMTAIRYILRFILSRADSEQADYSLWGKERERIRKWMEQEVRHAGHAEY